jgi:hypothetical protein
MTIKSIDPVLGKRYLDAWKTASTFLEAEKTARLRAMTDDEAREVMHAILAFPLPHDLPPRTCGLVEQQRWFQKLRPNS